MKHGTNRYNKITNASISRPCGTVQTGVPAAASPLDGRRDGDRIKGSPPASCTIGAFIGHHPGMWRDTRAYAQAA